VAVTAKNASGTDVTVTPQGRARCTAVTFESGYAELILNGQRVSMGDVLRVIDPSTSTTTAKTAAAPTLKYSI
jgi:hypothetical protein